MRLAVLIIALSLPACLKFSRKALTNQVPTAVAAVAPGDHVGPRAEVQLDASASSDPEARPLTYKWTQLSGDLVWAGPQREAIVAFVAPERPQTLLFAVEVSDGRLTSEAALVRIEVETNTAPIAGATFNGVAIAGASLGVDAAGSSDLDGNTLSYKWRSLSHPDLAFTPSDDVAAPTIIVPATADDLLRIGLVVSDGRATSPEVIIETRVQPGSTTHWFVDDDATCATCDGSREAPFKTIAPAVAANVTTPRPILVAAGYYGSLELTESANLRGGCDPADGWTCGHAGTPSILSGADNESFTVHLNDNAAVVVMSSFSIIGSFGLTVSGGSAFKSSAVRVEHGSITLDHCYVEAHGVGPNVDRGFGIEAGFGVTVHVFDSTVLGSRSLLNTVIDADNATELWIDRSIVRSKADARNGFLAPDLTSNQGFNDVLHVHGGGEITITRSQLIAEAADDQLQTLKEINVTSGLLTPVVFVAHTLLWHKGQGSGLTHVGPDATIGRKRYHANRMVSIENGGTFVFLNDTFLGNDAVWDPTGSLCLNRGASGCGCPAGFTDTDCGCPGSPPSEDQHYYACRGLYGFFMAVNASVSVTNSYFQKIHMLAYTQSSGRTITFRDNTLFEVAKYDGGENLLPSTNVQLLADGYVDTGVFGAASQAGEANVEADCLLTNPTTGDVHVGAGSPCIDSGVFEPRQLTTDLDGKPVPAGLAVDRGAYEVQP